MSKLHSYMKLARLIEDEVMSHGNRLLDRSVLHYLYIRMDLGSASAGDRSGLSYGRMALDLSEKGGQGSRNRLTTFTGKDVENCISRWVKRRFLVRSSKGKRLVVSFQFWLEYLSSLNSDQNEVRSKLGISKEVGSPVVTGSEGVSVQGSEGEVRTSLNKKKKTTVDAFVMTDDWEPSENFSEIVLSGLGLDVTPEGKHNWLLKRALMENRMYYQSGEMVTRTNNQHGWHRCLIYQMKVIYKAKKDEMSSKGSNVVPIAKAANAYRKKQDGSLIPRVPNFVDQKAMLDWWKQHAKLGAPSVSAKRYNDYKEWRYDLDQWRTNHLLELKKANTQPHG